MWAIVSLIDVYFSRPKTSRPPRFFTYEEALGLGRVDVHPVVGGGDILLKWSGSIGGERKEMRSNEGE